MLFLFIINLIIGLTAILLFFILYTKMSKMHSLENEYRQLLKEAEETISSFVYELKEDNERLLKKLSTNSAREHHSDKENVIQQNSFVYREHATKSEDLKELLQYDEHSQPLSTYEQAKELKNYGYSIDDIAQKLGKGKTEIELLLKFRQN
ncbi:hypothetical protein BC6307_12470 [Sutcliffiella cohnii]|uniref:Uncharacterized protein n=1 Tax=Sutcliffiella cohnii TaxID=33932 RepID=A0A223KRS6_9BACI|nr:hypothetical protein [Sutcliffiella cohnii]AST92033.1 hypothetical protein BC6307_12470 [Sutcliffiella cohnii]